MTIGAVGIPGVRRVMNRVEGVGENGIFLGGGTCVGCMIIGLSHCGKQVCELAVQG